MRTGLFLAILAAACGDDLSRVGSDGGPRGDAAAPPDGADLAIAGSQPADGATGVGVLVNPRVTFTADLDAASITPDSVQLWWLDGPLERVFGRPVYDPETRSISFEPYRALPRDGTLELRLLGITGAGQELSAALRFHTARNELVRSTAYTMEGAIAIHDEYDLDPAGRRSRVRRYFGEGESDMRGWFGYQVDDDGHLVGFVQYGDPGDDGDWMTDDDGIVSRWEYELENGQPVRASQYSATAELLEVARWDRDASGQVVFSVRFTGPGWDGVWFTTDDRAEEPTGWTHDDDGRVVERFSVDRGNDLAWGTPDDSIANLLEVSQYREDGLPLRVITHVGRGADGMWRTDDDVIGSYRESVYDGAVAIRAVEYGNRGGDGDWFTDDDRIYSYDGVDPLAKDLPARELYQTGAGEDTAWFTDDDAPSVLFTWTYDPTGARLESREIYPGADGVWWNEDDNVGRVEEYDPSH